METYINQENLDQSKEWRFWRLKHPDYLHPGLPHITTEKFTSIWELPVFIFSVIPFLLGLYILILLQFIPKLLGKNKITSEELKCLMYASYIKRWQVENNVR